MKAFWKTLLALVCLAIVDGLAQVAELTPEPTLSPKQVVEYQVSALQHNDDPHANAGIERAFRFASPANKNVTGPLEHFVSIVKSPAYLPMINHLASSVTGTQMEGDHARIAIRITPATGRALTYLFVLTRQHDNDFNNCWMTDSVVPIEEDGSQSDEAITI